VIRHLVNRYWAAVAGFALALFIAGLPIGMVIEGRHQHAAPAVVPAAVTCSVPAVRDTGLVVIPAGMIG
jgi:hypothetical protein